MALTTNMFVGAFCNPLGICVVFFSIFCFSQVVFHASGGGEKKTLHDNVNGQTIQESQES